MDPRHCEECGNLIPRTRLLALPDTLTCVACSTVQPWNENNFALDGTSPEEMARAVVTPEKTGGNTFKMVR